MRKHFTILLFLFSLYSFGQKRLLKQLHPGDTLKVTVERMGDRFGPHSRDTLLLVTKTSGNFIHSSKRNKWYTLSQQAYKQLLVMEKQGSKEKYSGQRVDLYRIIKQNNVSNFSLEPHYFDDFITQLKADSPDSQTPITD